MGDVYASCIIKKCLFLNDFWNLASFTFNHKEGIANGKLYISRELDRKNEVVDRLLMQEGILTTHPMDQGLEAEVMKISLDKEDFVLKVWNKSSKPDIRFQFGLLKALFKQGLKVSKPLGWGSDPNGNDVLLTTFDGTPVTKVNDKNMTALAKILSSIHQAPVEEICSIQLPQHDFIDYFFPRVREHTDIYHVLISLIQLTEIKQERMIHGDFHLENILDDHGRYTVIDWTNGQLGNPRYDLAWSLILKKYICLSALCRCVSFR